VKVLVMGAGVVGVTTAWYLAESGHEVVVLDRQTGPAMETSFANGGQVSPCHAEPWANPNTPAKALQWLGREDAPLIFRLNRWDPALWAWGLRFLRNCTPERAKRNLERTLRIALYSRECLKALRARTGISYDQKSLGILHVYRDPQTFQQACKISALMSQLGLERQIKTPAEAITLEPALQNVGDQLAGAIFTPGDESGDAHLFTRQLAQFCQSKDVSFQFQTRIHGLDYEKGRLLGVATNRGRFRADIFVMALGSFSPHLARHLGLRLPIYPAKGYSATLNVGPTDLAPTVSITDDEHKMVYSRLGNRLRCAGTAELAGWNEHLVESRANALVNRAKALFPRGGNFTEAELWAGLRPVTPDSVPILGKTKIDNLFLNTGHGTLGWTMSCGSGRVLADLISGRPTDIGMDGLGLERF